MRYWIAIFILIPLLTLAQEHNHNHSENQNPFEQSTEYVCPMHSQVVRDEPGTCPICGMDLVKKEPKQDHAGHDEKGEANESEAKSEKSFTVSESSQQAIRVTTAKAVRKDLQPQLMAQAQVRWQESAQRHIHSRAEGWVEELHADVEGQWVEKGDKLYSLYAPDLVVAQDDYLQLLDSLSDIRNGDRQQSFKRRGQQRLRLLGMTEAQIKALEQGGETEYVVDYYAPESGYITSLDIQEGMYVSPGLKLLTLTQDNQLWFFADVPARYSKQLKTGQMAHISSEHFPGGQWMNTIDYIYPQVDPVTQTIKVRIPVNDSIDRLREGLWATAHIELKPVKDTVVVPVASLIVTGMNNRVVVKFGEREFEVREVTTGLRVGNEIAIEEGLQEGESVVTSGQFLLDSEASLQGLGLNSRDDAPAPQHNH
ncbi:efflux RND transporter periplasmic adaptor subunit [Idiomarina sp. Sol25]|uniref:efflux RND transporter periplasmic adaptor subunit n=1 Tax=Idiomarina sp. Sol25 TaxID=3064000 RepID=UPI00294AED07|nr:efflux RND transporter periplasmic adaptor subunit [Idiomarina sp. Sol25]MDV6327965.1 efflux RND transporter periplasmic adaptor subunit [Idiomarina sp. Sol25]